MKASLSALKRRPLARASCAVTTLALTWGCASNDGIRTQELGAGRFQLECSSPLGRCSQEADELCGGRGYDVVQGYDQRRLLGHEAGESQVEVRSSRLVVVCRDRDGEPRTAAESSAPAPAPVDGAKSSSEPVRCTPGTTQQCFGPAACRGGQSCLPDGSGYGACDCGKVSAPTGAPPAPAP